MERNFFNLAQFPILSFREYLMLRLRKAGSLFWLPLAPFGFVRDSELVICLEEIYMQGAQCFQIKDLWELLGQIVFCWRIFRTLVISQGLFCDAVNDVHLFRNSFRGHFVNSWVYLHKWEFAIQFSFQMLFEGNTYT